MLPPREMSYCRASAANLTDRIAAFAAERAAFERRKAIEPELSKFVEKGNITLAQKSAFSSVFAAISDDLELGFSAYDGKGVYEFLWYFLNHLKSSGETASFAAAPKKKTCSKGVSCGNTCISGSKTCRKPLTPQQKEEVKEVVAKPPEAAKDKLASVKTPKSKPGMSDAKKEASTADAAKAKIPGKTIESNLLDMANGKDLNSVEISKADIDRAKKHFMDDYAESSVANKMDKMKAEAPTMPDDETLALSTWIGNKYASMNAVLYGGNLDSGVDKKAVETTNLLAAKALHRLPPATAKQIANEAAKEGESFDPDKPLGRYMTVDNPAKFVKRYQDALAGNGEIRESTFFATSHIDRADFDFCNEETNLTYEVKAKLDGTGSGRYIDHYKNDASEGEVLYPPQTKFRVVGVIAPKKGIKPDKLQLSQQEIENKRKFLELEKYRGEAFSRNNDKRKKAEQEYARQLYEEKTGKKLKAGDPQPQVTAEAKRRAYEDMQEWVNIDAAKAYKASTGKEYPTGTELDEILKKGTDVENKERQHEAKNELKKTGKNRDKNWVIQLEEI